MTTSAAAASTAFREILSFGPLNLRFDAGAACAAGAGMTVNGAPGAVSNGLGAAPDCAPDLALSGSVWKLNSASDWALNAGSDDTLKGASGLKSV